MQSQVSELPENQQLHSEQSKNKDKHEPEQMVPYFQLMRFATKQDKIFMWIGAFAAFANGSAFPLFALITGSMTDAFSQYGDDMVKQATWNAIWFILVGIGTMILSFIMFATWMITGERQSIQFRKHYFSAILKQEIGWFDTINPNELNSKIANESFAVQGAIGEKMPTFIMTFSMSFFGFLIGFIKGWELALVITACLPIIIIITAIFTIIIQTSETYTQDAYNEAGAIAEQAINEIKTVKMLDGEDFEYEKYSRCLIKAAKTTIKFNVGVGLSLGLLWASSLWSYAFGFWYGAKLISDQEINENTGSVYTVGDVLIIFMAVLTGGFSIGQGGPCLQNFAKGRAAAVKMFAILDRQPKIMNPIIPKGLYQFNGEILLNNIKFKYPHRPQTQVLDGLNLRVPSGKKVALVGESGCGKSTIMQLIERFYDCDEGSIIFGGNDGVDIRDLALQDLRSKIGMVGQEPVLFATTIRENLLYGNPNATEEEIIQSLKKVEAWDFVSKMEKQLDTYVGIGGGQLSGGQKQRIAIARAILKKPQVLLLDEATSALDRTTERLLQETLDEVSKNVTTIVIAHRLSTIQNADIIFVIDKGKVIEQGTHQELLQLSGKYSQLAQNQFQQIKEQAKSLSSMSNKDVKVEPEEFQIPKSPLIKNNQQFIQTAQKELSQLNTLLRAKEMIKGTSDVQHSKHEIIVEEDHDHDHDHDHQEEHHNELVQAEQTKQKEIGKKEDSAQMKRLFLYNKQERLHFIIGITSALINGCAFPLFSYYFSVMIDVLVHNNPKFIDYELSQDTSGINQDTLRTQMIDKVKNDTNEIALIFFLIGVGTFILWSLQFFFLGYVGEMLTYRLRQDTFKKLLRMPIPYFDLPKNNAGTLTSRLSVDCKLINGLTSSILGINLSNIGALISGLAIAFYASWALTLILLGMAPMSYIGGILQAQFLQGFSDLTDEAYKDSGNLIMEAVTNIRTVVSFGNEDVILKMYSKKVQLPLDKAQRRGIYAGLAFGFSNMQMFIIDAIIFVIGAILVRDTGLSTLDMFVSIMAITFATMGAGSNAAFAGDIGAAKNASKNIFGILDSEDEFQREDRLKKPHITQPIEGNIQVKNIYFQYEQRDKQVFTGLSLEIHQGQKVAFVGSSGCGKSTLMQMIMRFYEPTSGQILLDGIDITDYDIRYLRRQFGVVSQEPVLFNATIQQNIQYNLQNVNAWMIEEAAKKANAYQFIIKNQFEENIIQNKQFRVNQQNVGEGFDRKVGPKGTQISGGQKQRIAIARAILRNSHLLLLDEATSALDAQSEILVQESLNRLMENKTTIVIAHRISTIKDSNMIYVFENGKIVEQGTYDALEQAQGTFYKLEQGIAT